MRASDAQVQPIGASAVSYINARYCKGISLPVHVAYIEQAVSAGRRTHCTVCQNRALGLCINTLDSALHICF